MDDRTLAAAAAQGDRQALTVLVERYRRYIYAIAYKIALNEEDALDITQNVLLRVVRKIGDYSGAGAFRGWLGAIASREALTFVQRTRPREAATDPEVLTALSDRRPGPTKNNPREALDRVRRRELVERAMAGLSPQQRAIFALRFREQLTSNEVAERLGLPRQQVRSQFSRAVARLKDAIKITEGKTDERRPDHRLSRR